MARRPIASARYWDMAASEADGACFTAGVRGTLWQDPRDRDDWRVLVNDVIHGRWSPHKLEQTIANAAKLDGPAVSIFIEQEPGSSGIAVVSRYKRLLRGYAVRGDRPTGSKLERARPLAAASEAGLVPLARGEWNQAWLQEMEAFPNGPYADIVDATAGMFNVLTLGIWDNSVEGGLCCSDGSNEEREPIAEDELDDLPEVLRSAVEGFVDPRDLDDELADDDDLQPRRRKRRRVVANPKGLPPAVDPWHKG